MKKPFQLLSALAGLTWSMAGTLAAERAATPIAAAPAATNSPSARATNTVTAGFNETTYQPVPQDKFMFRIEEDPARGAEDLRTVSAQYDIYFPVTRGSDILLSVNVKGKTIPEIRQEIKRKLDADYYQDAHIYFKLHDQNVRAGRVYVTGAIKGIVQLLPGEQKTVFRAIQELGTNDFADLSEVKVFRYNPASKKSDIIKIDVKKMWKGGDRSQDMILQDEDRIEVGERLIVF